MLPQFSPATAPSTGLPAPTPAPAPAPLPGKLTPPVSGGSGSVPLPLPGGSGTLGGGSTPGIINTGSPGYVTPRGASPTGPNLNPGINVPNSGPQIPGLGAPPPGTMVDNGIMGTPGAPGTPSGSPAPPGVGGGSFADQLRSAIAQMGSNPSQGQLAQFGAQLLNLHGNDPMAALTNTPPENRQLVSAAMTAAGAPNVPTSAYFAPPGGLNGAMATSLAGPNRPAPDQGSVNGPATAIPGTTGPTSTPTTQLPGPNMPSALPNGTHMGSYSVAVPDGNGGFTTRATNNLVLGADGKPYNGPGYQFGKPTGQGTNAGSTTPAANVAPGTQPAPGSATNDGSMGSATQTALMSGDTSGLRNLLNQQVQSMLQAPDRTQLGQQAFNEYVSQTNPAYQEAVRNIMSANAAAGRIGSGITTNQLGDAFLARQNQLGTMAQQLATQAAGQTLADKLNQVSALGNTESNLFGQDVSGFNAQMAAAAQNEQFGQQNFQDQLAQKQLTDQLMNSQFNRNITGGQFDLQRMSSIMQMAQSLGMNPQSAQLLAAKLMGSQANSESGAGSQALFAGGQQPYTSQPSNYPTYTGTGADNLTTPIQTGVPINWSDYQYTKPVTLPSGPSGLGIPLG